MAMFEIKEADVVDRKEWEAREKGFRGGDAACGVEGQRANGLRRTFVQVETPRGVVVVIVVRHLF